jgi:hypothetical protein
MSSPKEKAHELLDKFWLMDKVQPMPTKEQAKQCALIAVNEILMNCCGSYTYESPAMSDDIYCDEDYWMEVEKEILAL